MPIYFIICLFVRMLLFSKKRKRMKQSGEEEGRKEERERGERREERVPNPPGFG